MDLANTTIRNNASWRQITPLKEFCCQKENNYLLHISPTNIFLRVALSLFIAISIISQSHANEAKLLIIKSGSAAVYNKIIQTAKSQISKACNNENCTTPTIQIESVGDTRKLRRVVRDNKWDLIITVGTKAAVQLSSYKTKTPTIYSLIPSHSYRAIKNNSVGSNISAIYVDQPLERQLQLIKTSLPEKKRVGVILGKHSGISKARLQRIMHNMGLTPVITSSNNDDIGASLKSIYKKIDVLLANPDPSIYNKKTVMTVLLSSYRYKVPVFGYSAAFVRSGATAAIYSSPANIGQQLGEEIVNYVSSNNSKLPSAGFPKYFSVTTNLRVIRTLNLTMPSTAEIQAGIRKAR